MNNNQDENNNNENNNQEKEKVQSPSEIMKETCRQLIDINKIRKITSKELKLNDSKTNIIG